MTTLAAATDWIYHLGDVDDARAEELAARAPGLLVVDEAHGDLVPYTPEEIAAMRGVGTVVAGYLSVGEAEDYRDYWRGWDATPPDFLGAANPEWHDNFKVAYWDEDWKEIVFDRVEDFVDAGFDGLYLDIVDAFWFWEEEAPGVRDYRADMVEFVSEIGAVAETRMAETGTVRPFDIVAQNGEELVETPGWLEAVDAIAKEDLHFIYENGSPEKFAPVPRGWLEGSRELLDTAIRAGTEVFVVEYATPADEAAHASEFAAERAWLSERGVPLFISPNRDLDTLPPAPDMLPDAPRDPDVPGAEHGGVTPRQDAVIRGGDGADELRGTSGRDLIDGRGGDDMIYGRAGGDIVHGRGGNDRIWGGQGDDTLSGDSGQDTLTGGWGDDSLSGGGGDDVLKATDGSDTLQGGTGADTFVFRHGTRHVVTDFDIAEDVARFHDVPAEVMGDDLGAAMRMVDGTVVVFVGLDVAQVEALSA